MAFDQNTRNRLQRFVADARSLLADEFTSQLQATYGMNPKTGEVADIKSLSGLTPSQQETAHLLRDTLAHYLASAEKGKEKARKATAIERIVREQAFTVLNRLAALRMSEAREFLIESLSKGYESKGFQLFKGLAGSSLGETGEAYRHYLYSLFDEFSLDLAVLFDRFSVQGRLFPSTPVLLKLLTLINNEEIAPLWAEDETIGWIYQYFNSIEERKKMRAESQAPRNSRELAVRNQFFTPRYVVEFLTDNTLGRIWYEMTQGETELKQSCKYLVRRPNELFLAQGEVAPGHEENVELSQEELLQQTVYIEHRALKDPRDIRMLDPACGSMHFGLYAFDLFEKIYSEAWDIEISQGTEALSKEQGKTPITIEYADKAAFLRELPRLIIENNIHGVDIDPRAAQIAGLSLWLRAHNSWQKAGIKPQQRPKIQRSNIVCAEPMPGEKALLQEFAASLKPTVLGQLVEIIFEKMELAGEAGTLLKIEQEIQDAIAEAKQVWQKQNQALNQFPDLAKVANQRGEIDFDVSDIDDEGFWQQAEQKILEALADYAKSATTEVSGQKRLFAEDATKGFAFIELCRKQFDVVLMNPPFGSPSINKAASLMLSDSANNNLYAAFVERGINLSTNDGYIGVITDRTFMLLPTYQAFREKILDHGLIGILDLNWGVLDDAQVATCAYVITNKDNAVDSIQTWFIDARENSNKEDVLNLMLTGENIINVVPQEIFRKIPTSPFSHWAPKEARDAFYKYNSLEDTFAIVRKGISPGDSDRFVKLISEVPVGSIGLDSTWAPYANGGSFSPFFRQIKEVLNWKNNGYEIKGFKTKDDKPRYVIRSEALYGKQGITFGKRGEVLNLQKLNSGAVFSNEGYLIHFSEMFNEDSFLGYLNSSFARYLVNMVCGLHKEVGAVKKIPIPDFLDDDNYLAMKSKLAIDISTKLNASEMSQQITSLPDNSSSLLFSDWLSNTIKDRICLFESLKNIAQDIDNYCFEKMCISKLESNIIQSDIEHLSSDWKVELSLKPKDFASEVISNAVGVICGWLSHSSFKHYDFDIIENEDLSKKVTETVEHLFPKDTSVSGEIGKELNVNNFIDYLTNTKNFFDFHLSKFTKGSRKAPIYWPLQTPSGSYTLWLYYHRLNEQTLFTCVNNFIEPKLDSVNTDLATLRNKPSRDKDEEKNFGRLTDLKQELENFRDELLRIAKFWKPNLNDGVQITAAPLWRLFQHKAWQKKLKETWEQLEAGEYDWAHLAYSIWPASVLRKCHQDRSLAIAHDVEDELWHEVEVIKPRKKEPVLEWQPKPFSDAELNAYIKAKVQALGVVE